MHLHCPQCSREITGENVNIVAAIAKCPACHAVFGFNASQIVGQSAALSMPRPEVAKPSQLTVEDSGREVKIWWNWLHWGLLPMTGFCLFWNGFLVVWYSIVISQLFDPQANADGGIWMAALFPILHVAVGATLGYTTLTGYLNTTVIEVNSGLLTIRHGPLPWWGNYDLETKSITQLFCTMNGVYGTWRQTSPTAYDLVAEIDDGTQTILISAHPDPMTIWYLEQVLEKHLKIEDERRPMEFLG